MLVGMQLNGTKLLHRPPWETGHICAACNCGTLRESARLGGAVHLSTLERRIRPALRPPAEQGLCAVSLFLVQLGPGQVPVSLETVHFSLHLLQLLPPGLLLPGSSGDRVATQ